MAARGKPGETGWESGGIQGNYSTGGDSKPTTARLYNDDVRIIAFSTLRTYYEEHADAETPLRDWYNDVSDAEWQTPNDVTRYASSVSLLSHERACFNIKGNRYRLIVLINYAKRKVYIKWVGTHAEYNKIDAETVQLREVR